MKKVALWIKAMGMILVLGALAIGCNPPPEDVETGGTEHSAEAEAEDAKEKNVKSFNADVTKEFMGVKVSIAEVKIKPDRIEVGMNYENKSGQSVHWYPDQEAKAVIGDMQLDSNMFLDDTACNLASINLKKCMNADGTFNVDRFRRACAIFITGRALQSCPESDPHSCALYFYTEPGDHIGFHFDTS